MESISPPAFLLPPLCISLLDTRFANHVPECVRSRGNERVSTTVVHRHSGRKKCVLLTSANAFRTTFFVDGSTIPLVDLDVGPSWSDLIPMHQENPTVQIPCKNR
ncbi:hypothetical protein OF83DRAFT_1180886 [Amylostereum chailletii]|nr:hypothetical protein OF83DRAFT_1180886 [Amylostereum chailletii]